VDVLDDRLARAFVPHVRTDFRPECRGAKSDIHQATVGMVRQASRTGDWTLYGRIWPRLPGGATCRPVLDRPLWLARRLCRTGCDGPGRNFARYLSAREEHASR